MQNSSAEEDKYSMKILTLHDVAELLENLYKKSGQFRSSSQRNVYEYIQKFLFASRDEINDAIKSLIDLGVPEKVAVQIAYILPVTRDELHPFLSQLRQMGIKIDNQEQFENQVLSITQPLWRAKQDLILSLRNLSRSQLLEESKKA